jgi:hypothetical protein
MTDAVAQNKQQLSERVEEIRSNQDLSDSAKQRMIGEAYDEAANRHGELVAEREEAAAREVAQRERSVFGLAYPKDMVANRDKEAFRQSYRDAAFRVFNMEPKNLERVLDRAERIGDEQLAQAVYHEALERGMASLANRYREDRLDAQQRWEKYVSARKAGESTEGLLFSGYSSVGPERPPEAGGMGGNAA